ncbi:8-amino-7-oxononanoate synthase [Psychromonas sp. CNPT3]|uniref:8-amino-7-oxononanoate synthase n=1 Tax=Psychromonas sp. CNPT3 TaxID=314282 RepID=UPI00006E98F6|nr:8-amino-7-oxononanoate synthase [Psychromonas sp. CNPT3]AGH81149.1 8-amino-7-oxononanoate synthase [Psychromonas sp. CNPT3]
MAFDFIQSALMQRKQEGLYRQTKISENAQGRYIQIAGQRYLNFSSNDYLGLAGDPLLIKAWQKGAQLFGVGSGGSYLVTGYQQAHADLCAQLKDWLGVPAVALFNSGYSANQAIIKLLLSKNALLVQDKLNHASLMEAGMLSDCKMLRFKHNDMGHLSQILQKNVNKDTLLISEGVFSMDGDRAPISDLYQQAKRRNAWLMIDDAHGLGVLGSQGKGSVVEAGLSNDMPQIYMATFGKALGVGGAFVAGSQELIDYITNFSKPYIYTTGLPPAMAYAVMCAADMVSKDNWRRDKLLHLIETFKRSASLNGIRLAPSSTAIQPLIIGSADKAIRIATQLKQLGFWVTAIRPPTVPMGQSRLRITLTTSHEVKDIQALMQSLSLVLHDNK